MAPKKIVPPKATSLAPTKNTDYDHVMIDNETLSVNVDGVILSIGACKFNATEIANDGFYRAITIQSNLDEHRTILPSTLRWWLDQSDKAKAVLDDPNAIPLGQALDELREWIGPQWKNKLVYGNGADFDISMLKHAYGSQPTPWEFFNVRCFRTLKSSAKAKLVPKPANAGAHNALWDAVAQAQHLQAIWKAGAA
jgi:DNA polymerase III epsilon subunit-like protein